MRFANHGQLSAKKDGDMLIIEGTGPWNIEMLTSAGADAKVILAELYKNPWAVLTIMHGEAVYLPDAAQKLIDIVSQEKTKNRIATAVLLSDQRMLSFARGHLSQIYNKAGETVVFFDNLQAAKMWLKEQLQQAKKTS